MARVSKARRREWAELQERLEGLVVGLSQEMEDGCPQTRDDMQQAARITLQNVVERHDPERGSRTTFAHSAMAQAMTRERRRLTDKGRMKLANNIDMPNERPEPLDALIDVEDLDRMHWALEQLPPIQKALVCHTFGLAGYEKMRIKDLERTLEIGHHGEGQRMLQSAIDALRRMMVDPEDN